MKTQYAVKKRPGETKLGTTDGFGVQTGLRKQCHPVLIKLPHHDINKRPKEKTSRTGNQPPTGVHPQKRDPSAIARKEYRFMKCDENRC